MKYQVAGSILLALLLTGCGEPDSGEATGLDLIRRGNVEDASTLDPALAEDIHTFNVLFDLYEGLVAEDAFGEIVPGVAESWSVSDSGLEYTFVLRADATWSNGERITADDFVQSLRRVAAETTPSPYASLLSPIAKFNGVKSGRLGADQLSVFAKGERTLVIELDEVCPYFLHLLAMPVAFPVFQGGKNPEQFKEPDRFVGNGAYVLSDRMTGRSITLRRSAHYWDSESVRIEAIEYLAITDEQAEFNMFRTGELDITASIPAGGFKLAERQFPEAVRVSPYLALYYLAFDLTEPPLDDARVRQALSMTIDRQKLAELLGRGEMPALSVVPPGVASYSGPDVEWSDLTYDARLSTARELMSRAGYSAEEPLPLHFVYDAGGVHETVALAVSSMWEDALDVEVKLDKREWKYFLDTRERREDWDVMRFAWFGDYNDASTFLDIFQSESVQNLSQYKSRDFDQKLGAAELLLDTDARATQLNGAERMLLEDSPVAPLYFFVSKHLVDPSIGGFEDNVLDRHPSKYLYRRQTGLAHQ